LKDRYTKLTLFGFGLSAEKKKKKPYSSMAKI